MKKRKYLIIALICIILVVSLVTYVFVNKNINIEDTKLMWNIYDMNIENIKNNLDPITNSNEDFYWWELKDFDIEDDEYEDTLNLLVADIRMCYLTLTDDGTLYTDSNPIRKYREKDVISKKELQDLNFYMNSESGCIDRFDRYLGVVLSSDEEKTDELLNKIDEFAILKKTDSFRNKDVSYGELLYRKIIETSLLEDLSEYVLLEYYRLK